ncbi:hypothetical protein AGMMS49982_15610 [Bacteroidia bacterium]|nr:hypothetical protein AGMMS49982_15610 [Bacteroidia bacterium]
MMKRIYIVILMLCFGGNLWAQEDTVSAASRVERVDIAVQLGTDIGGCVPFPLKYIPETFNMYPKLNLSLGGKFTFPIRDKWSVGAEVTYKTISVSADARVKNQRFQDKEMLQYFTGSAEMAMEFTMLEIPIYAKYTLTDKHKVLLGAYGTRVFKNKFVTTAKKGFIGADKDMVSAPLDGDLEMDFSNSLGSWDAGLVLGYERRLFSRLDVGLRFMCGFKDIFKPENQYFDYSMIHLRGVVAVSYSLLKI